jgi:hypothetical protein
MKKFIPLAVVGILVLCGLQAVASPFDKTETNDLPWETSQQVALFPDDLDQSQELMNWFGPIGSGPLWGYYNYIIAQSFTPTKNLLTKVELMIGRNASTTYPVTVAIRSALNGSDLTSITLPAADITMENFSWEEFDFADIMVTPGDTYYIVASTANHTENWYLWGAYMVNVYLNGTIFFSVNDETTWEEEPDGDLTFRTYGSMATTLDMEFTGGMGVTINTKNVGVIDAINVKTSVAISGGILGLINISNSLDTAILAPGDLAPLKMQPFGLGPITIFVTAYADNAVEVTKTAAGFVLFIFVFMTA